MSVGLSITLKTFKFLALFVALIGIINAVLPETDSMGLNPGSDRRNIRKTSNT